MLSFLGLADIIYSRKCTFFKVQHNVRSELSIQRLSSRNSRSFKHWQWAAMSSFRRVALRSKYMGLGPLFSTEEEIKLFEKLIE